MNINYKKRTITKVVVKPNTGLLVSHEGKRDKAGTISKINGELVCAEPDPAFGKSLKTLSNALVRSSSAGHFEQALRQSKLEDKLDVDQLSLTIKECLKFTQAAVVLTKLAIKYDGEEVASVKLWGNFTNHKCITIEISSPQIELNTEALYGWEPTLLKNVLLVIEATQEFLEGKYTALAIPEEVEKTNNAAEDIEDLDEDEAVENPGKMKLVLGKTG